MKKTFDNKKYIDLQTKQLIESINLRFDHVYLEIGGKFFDDQHASRVLSGFKPSVKYEIIRKLNIEKEFIICISTYSIKKSKKRRDSKKLFRTGISFFESLFVVFDFARFSLLIYKNF